MQFPVAEAKSVPSPAMIGCCPIVLANFRYSDRPRGKKKENFMRSATIDPLIEKLARMATTVFTVGVAVMVFAGFCCAQPSVTLNAAIPAPITSEVYVTGNGFTPYAAIDIYFDTTEEGLVLANSGGTFADFPIQVPVTALPGEHWVSAVQQSNGLGAQQQLLVGSTWIELGWGGRNRRWNPYENLLTAENVSGLDLSWSYPTGSYVGSSPALAWCPECSQMIVCIGSSDDNIYAFSEEGTLLWKYGTNGEVGSSPAVETVGTNSTTQVFAGSYDGHVYAINAGTGKKVWSYLTENAVLSSPVLFSIDSNGVATPVVSVGSNDEYVYALDAINGHLLWKYQTGGAVSSSPAFANGVVYVGSQDNNLYALNANTGALIWKYATAGPITNAPAVSDGVVYIGSSEALYAINAETGSEIWTFDATSPSVTVSGNWIYVAGGGYVYGLQIDHGSPIEEWDFTASGQITSAPALANGVVYVGSQDTNLYAINAQTGAWLWSYPTGGPVDSSPAVASGVVYVGSNDFNVYAFTLPFDETDGKNQPRPELKSLHTELGLKVTDPGAMRVGEE
jgi:outer membrane protein assembly factor BamB